MNEAVEKFKDFLNTVGSVSEDTHAEAVTKAAHSEQNRHIFNINDMRDFDRVLSKNIMEDPTTLIPFVEEEIFRLTERRIFFGLRGSFGEYKLTPRILGSKYIGKMVCVDGIVTSTSVCRPKVMTSVHYNNVKNTFYQKDYRDSTMVTKLPITNTVYPTRDMDGTLLSTEFGMSEYFDHQTVTLQEMPENAPPGQLPRSVEVILTFDLVDSLKPGDRARIFGIFKSLCFGSALFPAKFKTVLIANNVETLSEKRTPLLLDPSMLPVLSSRRDLYLNVAPSIYGSENIKKAIMFMLVGGNEVIMKNGSKIRGDINILLVGDPSTAKSQLLRYVLHSAPLAVATTGKGSSGVGLTAAVVLDKDTGDKRLEAGAMVLADRGVVCIDEFDKMNDGDRVAIHEVMEQQTVTIAKAGIHTTLNARCSVLAAANPIWGQYDESKPPQENVRLPESLLTRFDLIFITLDISEPSLDKRIADHVLRSHNIPVVEEDNQRVFLSFIQHCKKIRPVLSREAASVITKEYTNLRQDRENKREKIVSITPRLLETMIRLSTASAKLRMSEVVEEEDAVTGVEMIKECLYKKIIKECKRIKVEEEEEKGNLRADLQREESKKEVVINALYDIRQGREDVISVEMREILSKCEGLEEEDVRNVLEELAEQEIIMFEEEKVFFFN